MSISNQTHLTGEHNSLSEEPTSVYALYDELLQFTQGLVLGFEAAQQQITGNQHIRNHLECLLAKADSALRDARKRFQAAAGPPEHRVVWTDDQ